MARQARNSVVGASTAVWPSGQTTLTVTYTPGRTIAAGNTLVTQEPDALNAEIANARIQSITHLDTDHISGVGTVPAGLFGPRSTRGQVRFRAIVPSEPVVIVFAVDTAPTANRDFPTCLAPLDPVLRASTSSRNRRAVSRAFQRAARRKPGFFRRVGRGIWKRLKSPFRRIFGAAGQPDMANWDPSGSDIDEAVGEALGAAFMADDNPELEELLGAFEEELYDTDWDEL